MRQQKMRAEKNRGNRVAAETSCRAEVCLGEDRSVSSGVSDKTRFGLMSASLFSLFFSEEAKWSELGCKKIQRANLFLPFRPLNAGGDGAARPSLPLNGSRVRSPHQSWKNLMRWRTRGSASLPVMGGEWVERVFRGARCFDFGIFSHVGSVADASLGGGDGAARPSLPKMGDDHAMDVDDDDDKRGRLITDCMGAMRRGRIEHRGFFRLVFSRPKYSFGFQFALSALDSMMI